MKMSEVTIEQVVELVQSNEEVRNALQGQFVNKEAFTAFMETDEGKAVLQPKLDSFASTSINTWKHNNLQKEIDKALVNANPADTPEQKRIKELELQFQAQQEKATFAEQKAYALNLANQYGLPSALIDPFVGKDAQATLSNMNNFRNEFQSAVQVSVESHMGTTGRSHLPDNPNVNNQSQGTPTYDIPNMSYTEKVRAMQTDPVGYRKAEAQLG
ncbi:hypothetical protein BMBphi_gp058 [Bacillus phage vB_BthS_BMBphi]|nr:hypothetical protein BMBphi_gp058 [Bacillus phage vB_BthS_BMBphi]